MLIDTPGRAHLEGRGAEASQEARGEALPQRIEAYEAPKLVDYGPLHELVAGVGGSRFDFNGCFRVGGSTQGC